MSRKAAIIFATVFTALLASLSLNLLIGRKAMNYYSQLQAVRLDPLGLNENPTSIIPANGPMIVLCGDSRAKQWPVPAGFNQGTVINRGIGNQTTAQVLGRFQRHVASLKPNLIILQVGINDLKTLPQFPKQKAMIVATCKSNISALVSDSLACGARVIVTTIFPLGKVPIERRPFWSEDVAAAIVEVNAYLETLRSDRVAVFDTGRILSGAQGSVAPQYSHDLLHINPEGYAALNRAIAELLKADKLPTYP